MDLAEKVSAIKGLLSEYEEKRNILDEKEREVKQATFECSELVKKIGELLSPKRQLTYKGKKLTIVERTAKKSDGHVVHFIRGWGDRETDLTIE